MIKLILLLIYILLILTVIFLERKSPAEGAFVGARNGLSALRRSCPLPHLWQHDGDKADRGRKERFQESIFLMFAPLM